LSRKSGRIGVSVFSVKSCCRPRITIRNPSAYPSFATSGRHVASGRCPRRSASAIGEKPIDNPAASPEKRSDDDERASSSSASVTIAA